MYKNVSLHIVNFCGDVEILCDVNKTKRQGADYVR